MVGVQNVSPPAAENVVVVLQLLNVLPVPMVLSAIPPMPSVPVKQIPNARPVLGPSAPHYMPASVLITVNRHAPMTTIARPNQASRSVTPPAPNASVAKRMTIAKKTNGKRPATPLRISAQSVPKMHIAPPLLWATNVTPAASAYAPLQPTVPPMTTARSVIQLTRLALVRLIPTVLRARPAPAIS